MRKGQAGSGVRWTVVLGVLLASAAWGDEVTLLDVTSGEREDGRAVDAGPSTGRALGIGGASLLGAGLGTALVSAPVEPSRGAPTREEAVDAIRSRLGRSMLDWSVSDADVRRAHELLTCGVAASDFNAVVRTMADEGDGWMLERYVHRAQQQELLHDFARRLSTSMDEDTARALLTRLSPETWGDLSEALADLSPRARSDFVNRCAMTHPTDSRMSGSGADVFSALHVLRAMQARDEGLREAAAHMSHLCEVIEASSVAVHAEGVVSLLYHYPAFRALSLAPGAVLGALEGAITNRHTCASDFRFVVEAQEAGVSQQNAYRLLNALKSLYRGE